MRGPDWFGLCGQVEGSSTAYEPVTVCVPAEMPPVVPVTGESFCQCPAQTARLRRPDQLHLRRGRTGSDSSH